MGVKNVEINEKGRVTLCTHKYSVMVVCFLNSGVVFRGNIGVSSHFCREQAHIQLRKGLLENKDWKGN